MCCVWTIFFATTLFLFFSPPVFRLGQDQCSFFLSFPALVKVFFPLISSVFCLRENLCHAVSGSPNRSSLIFAPPLHLCFFDSSLSYFNLASPFSIPSLTPGNFCRQNPLPLPPCWPLRPPRFVPPPPTHAFWLFSQILHARLWSDSPPPLAALSFGLDLPLGKFAPSHPVFCHRIASPLRDPPQSLLFVLFRWGGFGFAFPCMPHSLCG